MRARRRECAGVLFSSGSPRNSKHLGAAVACFIAIACGYLNAAASTQQETQEQQALALLNGRAMCAGGTSALVAQATSPSPSPTASPMPGFQIRQTGNTQIVLTPRPSGSASPSPLPLPASPSPAPQGGLVYLPQNSEERGGETPPPITPAGEMPPSPTPVPSDEPTLPPGYVAVIADHYSNKNAQKPGQPQDMSGNVHIYYSQGEIVGDRAHYDGDRTVTITGNPFIIDREHDSILRGETITFDTVSQTARLSNGNGESSQGVERGLIHYSAQDLHTDSDGVAHGAHPNVTTCEHPRGGYHVTGKTMDVVPGDRIVIYDAILWLGAAAVFWLPKLVIPLRSTEQQNTHPQPFPDVGYDQYEGYYILTKIGFGSSPSYYGYYVLNYYTKVGLGYGYVAFFTRKNGKRAATINFYRIHDRRVDATNTNLSASEQENYSNTLHSTVGYTYQSNYGPLTNLPANESLNLDLVHQTPKDSQTYTFSHSAVGTQSTTNAESFADLIQFTPTLSNALNFNMTNGSSSYGGFASSNASATLDEVLHWTTSGADYELTYDKTYARVPYGDDEIPQLAIRPLDFFPHFLFPMSAQFQIGEYSEPSNAFSTSRADMAFVFGPWLYKFYGSDFQATVDVTQFAYGTGDLKAAIQQLLSLTTPISDHLVNMITYNEANYNGPAAVPFEYLDQQPTENNKTAQDLLRFFNGSVYNVSLGFSTLFDAHAQPVSYQVQLAPSTNSVVLLGGAFLPGPGMGFEQTNVQFSTPFGRDTQIEFAGNVNWNIQRRISDKIVYITKTIGNCYQIQALYNEDSKLLNVSLNLLAFPSQPVGFGVGQGGSIIPSNLNF